MSVALPDPVATPETTFVWISKILVHAERNAEVILIAGDTGQTIFKCPEHVTARAATSRYEMLKSQKF
eukprot:6213522-Pleurochrysis_carterae.AAC.3